MLLSITFDNSGMPEAFAANIIKSVLCISVTQTTLKKDKRPHVFAADASSQLEVSKCCCVHHLLFKKNKLKNPNLSDPL